MRYGILVLLLLISLPVVTQNAVAAQDVPQGILIHDIAMEGFVLGDKEQFTKLFKPYRNKYVTAADMDKILQEIQIIYEQEGYQQLVSITYEVKKHRLVYTALMTS